MRFPNYRNRSEEPNACLETADEAASSNFQHSGIIKCRKQVFHLQRLRT